MACSRPFVVGNGVKQGGVISPIMFCIHIDCLLGALQNSGSGCYIGRMFLGALAYADDIVLLAGLAPTPGAMRAMLAISDSYSDDLHIVFNTKKSKCMYMGPGRARVSTWFARLYMVCRSFILVVQLWS